MKNLVLGPMAIALILVGSALADAQVVAATGSGGSGEAGSAAPADSAREGEARAPASTFVLRPTGQDGLNTFEAPKFTGPFDGIKVTIGGAFSLDFQALDHENSAEAVLVDGVNTTQLADIRPGISLPTANLNLGVQIANGINMVLESYMSSRHHNEFWVKGGYATIDASPIDNPLLNDLMRHVTIRAGMYEPNYGDAHYRRSDNGNTINNPFAENLILDAFTTEPGMDVMVRVGDAFVMGGVTSGENKGNIKAGAVDAAPALLAKVGWDKSWADDLRFRLSGSVYSVSSTPSGTLYAGDRTGSHYWGVADNAAAASFTNGRLNPRYSNEVTAFQINPFVKVGDLELFGVLERASGKAVAEPEARVLNQYAADAVYRFLDDRLYVAGRYNLVKGDLSAANTDITVDRAAIAAGWFIGPTLLTKVEYVRQGYDGFAATDILHGAEFSGVVIQGAISF